MVDIKASKKKRKTVILVMLGIIIAIAGIVVIMFFIKKSKIKPFYDENVNVLEDSVAEKIFLDVNGTKNGIIIRGKNIENPVILFVSGGPGVPEYWLNEYYENRLEEEYTVCWWDYYGECLSYDKSIRPENITPEKLEADMIVVTEYLKERFGQERIILMGHSAGTMLTLRMAAGHPELYCCYIGMGQAVGNQYDRCTYSYRFMKKLFEERGNIKAIKKMDSLVETDEAETVVAFKKEPIGMHWENVLLEAGCATTREMRSDVTGIFFPQMFSKCYTGKEKINYWKGKGLLGKSGYVDGLEIGKDEKFTFEIPIYLIQGYYDYTSPTPLVEMLYENIEAPRKELKLFENSAHSPLWEENEAVMSYLRGARDNDIRPR